MIHMAAVSDLMRDDPAQQVRRGKDQPPVEPDRAACRAAAPAARGVANCYRSDADPGLHRNFRSFGTQPNSCLGPKIAFDPWRKGGFRPATAQDAGYQARSPGGDLHPSAIPPYGLQTGSPNPDGMVRRAATRSAAPRPIPPAAAPIRPRRAGSSGGGKSASAAPGPRPAVAASPGRADGDEAQWATPGPAVLMVQSGRSTRWNSNSPASISLIVQPRVDCPTSCTVSRLPEIR